MADQPPHPPRPRRIDVKIPITRASIGMFLDSEIMNLSKGGVFIRSDIALPLGTIVDFEFNGGSIDKPRPMAKQDAIFFFDNRGRCSLFFCFCNCCALDIDPPAGKFGG